MISWDKLIKKSGLTMLKKCMIDRVKSKCKRHVRRHSVALGFFVACLGTFSNCSTTDPYTELINEIQTKSMSVEYTQLAFKLVDKVNIKAPVVKSKWFS